MAAGFWIGGFLGFAAGGALGALIGAVIGLIIDGAVSSGKNGEESGGGTNRAYGGAASSGEGQRNSFLLSLMVLASYIIKADNKIMHSEMEAARAFLRNTFGETAERQGNAILLALFEERKKMEREDPGSFHDLIRQACLQIKGAMTYPQRLMLLSFLVDIARADGTVVREEMAALRKVASLLGIRQADLESMLHLGSSQGESEYTLADAYKALGINSDATDDEVRRAYRRLALRYHPDKVATLGEDIRLAATKKLQEINAAKEMIYKARGM